MGWKQARFMCIVPQKHCIGRVSGALSEQAPSLRAVLASTMNLIVLLPFPYMITTRTRLYFYEKFSFFLHNKLTKSDLLVFVLQVDMMLKHLSLKCSLSTSGSN